MIKIDTAKTSNATVGFEIYGKFHLNNCVIKESNAAVPKIYPIKLCKLIGSDDMNFPTLTVHNNIPTIPKMITATLGPYMPKTLTPDNPKVVILTVITISKMSTDTFFINYSSTILSGKSKFNSVLISLSASFSRLIFIPE